MIQPRDSRVSRSLVLRAVALVLCLSSAGAVHAVEPWLRSGPEGGEIFTLAADPLRPGHLFASPWFEGLFESFDYGETWTEVKGAPYLFAGLVFDPFDQRRIYANCWGFAVSEDGGKSWRYPVPPGVMFDGALYRLSASRRVRGLLYIATYRGVYRSNDGGNNWVLSEMTETDPERVVTASASEDAVVFTTGSGSTLRSDDYGTTWKEVIPGSLAVAFSPHEPRRGIAWGMYSGVYTTTDGGATWTPPSGGTVPVSAVTFDPEVPGRLFGMNGREIRRSDDWGRTWVRLPLVLPHLSPNEILITANPRRMFVTIGGYGVYEVLDFGVVKRNRGLYGLPATSVLRSGSNLLAGTWGGGAFASSDGAKWRELEDPSTDDTWSAAGGEHVTTLAKIGNSVIKSSNRGTFRSNDDGETWSKLGLATVNQLVEGRTAQDIYAAGWGQIFKSVDGGVTWTSLSGPFAGKDMNAIHYDKTKGLVFAGTYRQGEPFFRSADHGATWTEMKPGFSMVQSFVQSPHGGMYVATRHYGVYRTDDGGDTWTRLTDASVRWMNWIAVVAFDPADPDVMVLGTQGYGAYASIDGARTFFAIDALRDRTINAILRDGSRWIFATDEGVYLREDPLVVARRRSSR